MAVRKKFFEAWKSSLPLLSASFCSLIMVVVEETIESGFKCPQRKGLRICLGFSIFIVPAFILFAMSLILQRDFIAQNFYSEKYSHKYCCEIVGKAVGSSLLWCVILLIDGRYSECINTAFKGNSTEPTAQTMPAELASDFSTLSQVFGLFALFVIICVYCLYTLYPLWCCCVAKEERKKIESQGILEEEVQSCIAKEKKYVQEIVKNVLVSKFQDHLKNVSNGINIRGLYEEVKKSLNPPATSQTPQMEIEI